MLKDIYYVYNHWCIRDRKEINTCVNMILKCMDCNGDLSKIFYYINTSDKEGFTCCGITEHDSYSKYRYIIKLNKSIDITDDVYDQYSD